MGRAGPSAAYRPDLSRRLLRTGRQRGLPSTIWHADPALGEAGLAEAEVQPPQPEEALVVAERREARRRDASTFARQRRSVSA